MRQAIRLAREIFAMPSFDKFRGAEIQPGVDVTSDKQLDEFIKNMADSAYHPSCTCKMGEYRYCRKYATLSLT